MGLQEGIYYCSGEQPARCFALLFLRVDPDADAALAQRTLAGLWSMYQELKRGHIGDLPGVALAPGELSILVAYGSKAFSVRGAKRRLPSDLGPKHHFKSPLPSGGGELLAGAGLRYAPGIGRNPATEEVLVQAIAETPLAANRVIVETAKYLDDHPAPALGRAPFALAAAFTGFNREDRRSWIDFHDGISNLTNERDRLAALEIKREGKPEQDRWTVGGTYVAFMRIAVNLRSWRRLSLVQQELLVGRSKITGCPIAAVDNGTPVSQSGCPFGGSGSILERGNEAFREPPTVRETETMVLQSHVQRANHHVGPIDRDVSRRIFRQGYEFLEPPGPGRELTPGLNFVSFQDTPARLFFLLTTPGWLGGVNFGGDPKSQLPGMDTLLSVHAAGVYLCPPVSERETFPGQSIFAAVR